MLRYYLTPEGLYILTPNQTMYHYKGWQNDPETLGKPDEEISNQTYPLPHWNEVDRDHALCWVQYQALLAHCDPDDKPPEEVINLLQEATHYV